MGNLHGAPPNVSAPGFFAHTFSIGRDSPGSIPTQSPSYLSAMHVGSPFIASTMSSGQQVMNMPPSRQQADAEIGGNGVTFGSLDTVQQPTSGYLLTSPPSSFPSNGGNPFG
uniref:Putative ADP-ribosylation factor GTPase-activating protein AGD14 isoform X1 n=1 Tax=Rhizophora mucronata TaxID=61149 RepID=A0A2P2JH14_RHIMU